MFARLNLASQPFRNRTLPWTVAVVVFAVSLVALVFIVGAAREARGKADRVAEDVQKYRRETESVKERAAQLVKSVSPEDLRSLEAAQTLVDRKRFSWSQLLADLESVLSSDVRVTRISVREVAQVGGQMRADLDLAVVGRNPADVIDMIEQMRRTGVFNAVPVSENPRQGRGEAGFEWSLRVGYVQRAVGGARGGENVASAAPASDAPEAEPARDSRRGAR